MKIYLFENATVSNNYHSGGSIMFLAESKEQVLEMLPSGAVLDADDWDNVRVIEHLSLELPEVFVFEDAGCC
jgi:hypothetical protein